jgi:hypothetical protein
MAPTTRADLGDCLHFDFGAMQSTALDHNFHDFYRPVTWAQKLTEPYLSAAWAAQVNARYNFIFAGANSESAGSRDNHNAAVDIPFDSQRWVNEGRFNLPAGYKVTIQDRLDLQYVAIGSQMAWAVLKNRWDTPARPPAPPGPPIVTPPVVTPPQPPAEPPAAAQGLPPLTPASVRITEIERRVVTWLGSLLPATWSALPISHADFLACLKGMLAVGRPLSIAVLKSWRRFDPRPLPPEDL